MIHCAVFVGMSGKQPPPPAPGVLGGGSGHLPMDKEALLKPIVFPNHQRHFKIFTAVVSAGRLSGRGEG